MTGRQDPQRHEPHPVAQAARQHIPVATTNGAATNGVIATGAAAPVRTASTLRTDGLLAGTKSNGASIRPGTEQPTQMAAGTGSTDQPVSSAALKSLRERLIQRNQR
jgi:hypothetical protein